MNSTCTYRFEREGSWSGGGAGLLSLADWSVSRIEQLDDDAASIPIIARNVPVGGRILAAPFVLAPQNAWPWTLREIHRSEFARMLALRIGSELHMRRATAVLRISSAIPMVGDPNKYSPVLHNVLDPKYESALAESDDVDPSLAAGRIVCVGSVTSYRNLMRLIDAYSLLGPRETRGLLICGPASNHSLATKIAARARETPGVDVRWGKLTRASCLAYFKAASAVILPSFVEASPFTLLEALSVQPRVIVSGIPGHKEIVQPFGSLPEEAFFDAKSTRDMARAMEMPKEAGTLHSGLSDAIVRERARHSWAERLGAWLRSLDCPPQLSWRRS